MQLWWWQTSWKLTSDIRATRRGKADTCMKGHAHTLYRHVHTFRCFHYLEGFMRIHTLVIHVC